MHTWKIVRTVKISARYENKTGEQTYGGNIFVSIVTPKEFWKKSFRLEEASFFHLVSY